LTVYDIKDSNAVGTYDQPGLPNITGFFDNAIHQPFESTPPVKNQAFNAKGAFYNPTRDDYLYTPNDGTYTSQPTATINDGIEFDASRSNAIYGASTTVQPPATEMYLYFYVGQYKRDEIYNAACLNKAYVDEKISEMSKNMRDYTIDFTKTDGFMNGKSWPMNINYPSRIEVRGVGNFYMSTDGINYILFTNEKTEYSSTVFYTSDSVTLSGTGNSYVYVAPIKG
jgi:hypothetical protein